MNKFLLIFSVFVPLLAQASGKNPPPPGGPPPPPGLPIDQYQVLLFLAGLVLFFVYRKKFNKTI